MERQREDCLAIAGARGWQVVAEYVDNSISASDKRKARPQYDAMVRAHAAGQFGALICWDLDRLTRQPRQLEDWIDAAEERGLILVTANGEADLSTDGGRLFARIKASVARSEIERKSARQHRANLQRAEAGEASTGGIRTLGYTAGMRKIDRREAQHIRAGFSGLLAGQSLRSIARQWNDAGFLTAHGGQWDGTDVRSLLRNVRYTGLTKHRGAVVGTGKWTPLVTEDVFRAVQAVLDDPERKTTPATARRYMLSGLAFCGCGAKVLTGRTQHGTRTYRCSETRGHMSRGAVIIDEWVRALVLERLSRPDAGQLLIDYEHPNLDALRDEASAMRTRLGELADLLADPTMPTAQTIRGIDAAKVRLAAIEAEMANAAQVDVLGPLIRAGDLVTAWEACDLDRKRAVIDNLMTVKLHAPGRGKRTFDPETITIDWKA